MNREEEEQLALVHHLSFSQTAAHRLARPGARFVSIILDNLRYNLVCPLFLNAPITSLWMMSAAAGGGGEVWWVGEEAEAVAPFLWL